MENLIEIYKDMIKTRTKVIDYSKNGPKQLYGSELMRYRSLEAKVNNEANKLTNAEHQELGRRLMDLNLMPKISDDGVDILKLMTTFNGRFAKL